MDGESSVLGSTFVRDSRGPMSIRELAVGDACEYRALRLRALKEHPTAFSASYEQQRDRPVEGFAERLRGSFESSDGFILAVSSTRVSSAR